VLRIERKSLPPQLQKRLDDLQSRVEPDKSGDSLWKEFKKEEAKRAQAGKTTGLAVLEATFHSKCAK
jgi:hypothetical protein